MSSELDTWSAEIQAHALDSPPFKSLPEADLRTDWARFYWYPNKEKPIALIKVFTGGTAPILFRQEITALYGLRTTRRVCTVLCDSTRHDPKFWVEDFSGPYFIAKLYYPKSLASALRATTGLEKLDFAAQEIDIARQFLRLRWRDYDWRKENDVIHDGKLLRVDLDSASALSAMFEEKSTIGDGRYFSTAESVVLQSFLRLRESILNSSETNEVRNLAIRLSHTIFIDDNDENRLTTLIGGLQANDTNEKASEDTSAGEPVQNGSESVVGKVAEYAKQASELVVRSVAVVLKSQGSNGSGSRPGGHAAPDSPNGDSAAGNRDTISLLDEWTDLWLGQAPSKAVTQVTTPQSLSQLTHDEWGLLARLFHHLIKNADHGFTLADFHTSMLMLVVAFLRDRWPRIAVLSSPENELLEILAPNTGFNEFHGLVAPSVATPVEMAKDHVNHQPPKRQPMVAKKPGLKIEFSSGSGHWAASAKELRREGEDRAFVFTGKHLRVVAVTDGVSDASGLDAALTVEKELQEWSEQLTANSPEGAADEMRSVLRKINAHLIRLFKETNRAHQAMLVMAVVGKKEDSCFVSIAQAGDSDAVVFYPNGSLRFSTKSWSTLRLGTSETLKDEGVRVEHISLAALGESGSYRIRLFSDGVGERGYERVSDVVKIKDLVDEAGHWAETLGGAVGHDDWSIAGLDISMQDAVEPVEEPGPDDSEDVQEESEPEMPILPTLLESVNKADAAKFTLSDRAKEFWRNTISTAGGASEAARFRFICDVVGYSKNAAASVTVPPKTAPPRTAPPKTGPKDPSPNDKVKTSWFVEWKDAIVALGVVVAILGFVVTLVLLRSPSSPNPPTDETAKTSADSSTEGAARDPEFTTAEQSRIYLDLKDRTMHVRDGMPGGELVTDPQVKAFLGDLAQVLIQSKYKIEIEAFSAPGGDEAINLKKSERRAKLIKQTLINDYKVPEPQVVDAVGRGFWAKAPVDLGSVKQINTTGAIFIIRRR